MFKKLERSAYQDECSKLNLSRQIAQSQIGQT
jgi:hypothetical protein